MFKKPLAHRSNATPLRSSSRRQLVAAILQQYPDIVLHHQSPSAAGSEDGAPGGEKELGKVLVPEGVRSGGFETSSGVEGTMYFSANGDPLWMTFGRSSSEYIPTLYLLSLPHLPTSPLPVLQIHDPLPPPLLTGAPLFLPAVVHKLAPHLLADVPEGGLVAFCAGRNDGGEVRYVGVGRVVAHGGVRGAVERWRRHREEGVDRDEGKFAEVLCIEGDHLWEMGSKPAMPIFALPPPAQPLQEAPVAGPSRHRSPTAEITDTLDATTLSSPPSTSPPRAADDVGPLTPAEISTLLTLALLQALQTLAPTSFPIPASTLYSAHILPARPAFVPREKRDEVVIGKSEWKKLAKWMKEVGKDGVLRIKESKGEVMVQGYDANHPSIINHISHTTIAEEEAKAAKKAARAAAAVEAEGAGLSTKGKGKGKEIDIEELWKPSGASGSFWEAAGVDKSTLHPSAAFKEAVDAYIAKHHLVDRAEPRYILLDEELGRAVGIKRPEPGERMPKDEVMRKLRAGVNWSMSVGGVVKKGALQPVMMSVKTRQGRKTVTIITGLETFGIDIDEFAEELKKLCAGSASVQPLQGASPKLNLSEIMVQGSQVKVVTEALLARGVPKKWIREGEGDKKKK